MYGSNSSPGESYVRFRVILRVTFAAVLLAFLCNHNDAVSNSQLSRKSSVFVRPLKWGNGFRGSAGLPRRRMSQGFDENLSESGTGENTTDNLAMLQAKVCSELFDLKGYRSRCNYVITHPECDSGGFFSYIRFFYCSCKSYSFFGYLILGAWLVIMFYLLGNTAADYFCCSLEKLSNLLKLSPTVAGVSLLPLGNGAPDVFASIAAFLGTGSGELGLSSVLGGAVFVTCIVVGVVSLYVAKRKIQIDRNCFVRDICFFLLTLLCLAVILLTGKVSIGGAIAFVSIYVLYAFSVALNEILRKRGQHTRLDALCPLHPVVGNIVLHGCNEDEESLGVSLLDSYKCQDNTPYLSSKIPHWVWASNVAIYSDYDKTNDGDGHLHLWGWSEDDSSQYDCSMFSCSKVWSWVEIPLAVPRRLTIPIVEEERWSKPYAVSSAFLGPLLLAFLWNSREEMGTLSEDIVYAVGFVTGLTFAVLACAFTRSDHPPRKFLFPWLFGGFFMSIVWFYIIASELVALLVSLGTIMGIKPSLLAITILAWGNSMGDLMSNTALAMNGDQNRVQIAMSGCYAGPMFNTLVGLGISMLLGAWSQSPKPYSIPGDKNLFYTMGFLVAGLVWSLVVLPQSDMRPNKILGLGLITIYFMFLCFQLSSAMGVGLT